MGGHGGVLKTQKRIGDILYWSGIMQDIRQYVAACQVCQRYKYSTLAPGGHLQPLPIPEKIWEDLSMDFVEGLPKSGGNNAILVVVDRLSKYTHFLRLKQPFTAADVANLFVQEIIKIHGFPQSIVSDRDKVFTSQFWKVLFKLAGPREPPPVIKYENGSTANADLEKQMLERDAARVVIKAQLHKAQQQMKKRADGHRKEVEFEIGEQVYLKMRPYQRRSLARGEIPAATPILAQLTDKGFLHAEPEAVVGTRKNPVTGKSEVLIRWKGLLDYESSWEWVSTIKGQFPKFNLENKVALEGEGNDTYEVKTVHHG
ncbi:PREDICTED: uncharacterized protein K02A2.6-like [Camelina sativa]|uniref:Uncharacterized protein K02A2.6-like n=1 Tax=Camelina sativa TaxID=90675 RepID=A0ABM0SKI3_CAMSA|nr:PREDICTED: uncharacterized protein K02A2.6-like [Camelina sativa]